RQQLRLECLAAPKEPGMEVFSRYDLGADNRGQGAVARYVSDFLSDYAVGAANFQDLDCKIFSLREGQRAKLDFGESGSQSKRIGRGANYPSSVRPNCHEQSRVIVRVRHIAKQRRKVAPLLSIIYDQ